MKFKLNMFLLFHTSQLSDASGDEQRMGSQWIWYNLIAVIRQMMFIVAVHFVCRGLLGRQWCVVMVEKVRIGPGRWHLSNGHQNVGRQEEKRHNNLKKLNLLFIKCEASKKCSQMVLILNIRGNLYTIYSIEEITVNIPSSSWFATIPCTSGWNNRQRMMRNWRGDRPFI